MPIYEYRCRKCGHAWTQAESITEHGRKHPVCPMCKARAVVQVFAAFFAKTVRKS